MYLESCQMTHYAKPCDAPKIGYGQSLLKDIWCLPQINCPLSGDANIGRH